MLWWRLPGGLHGAPVDLKTWINLGRNPMIMLLLAITTLQMSGQFVVFTFMGPLLAKLTGASPDAIGIAFALYGLCGFIGIMIATRIVDSWGSWKTSVLFTGLLLAGVAGRALSAGAYVLMAASVAGGARLRLDHSMQQVRLVAAAPSFASASVSLNTSVLYVGQAVGSAIGGLDVRARMAAQCRLCCGGVRCRGAGDRDRNAATFVRACRPGGIDYVRDPRQHRLEVDARQLQRFALEVDHVAVLGALQHQRDHVGPEQRPERRIGIVALGRDLDVNAVTAVGVVADERKRRIAAAKLTVDGVEHTGAGAVNGVIFELVKTFLQYPIPEKLLVPQSMRLGA